MIIIDNKKSNNFGQVDWTAVTNVASGILSKAGDIYTQTLQQKMAKSSEATQVKLMKIQAQREANISQLEKIRAEKEKGDKPFILKYLPYIGIISTIGIIIFFYIRSKK